MKLQSSKSKRYERSKIGRFFCAESCSEAYSDSFLNIPFDLNATESFQCFNKPIASADNVVSVFRNLLSDDSKTERQKSLIEGSFASYPYTESIFFQSVSEILYFFIKSYFFDFPISSSVIRLSTIFCVLKESQPKVIAIRSSSKSLGLIPCNVFSLCFFLFFVSLYN